MGIGWIEHSFLKEELDFLEGESGEACHAAGINRRRGAEEDVVSFGGVHFSFLPLVLTMAMMGQAASTAMFSSMERAVWRAV